MRDPVPTEPPLRVLFHFEDAAEVAEWRPIDDVVMGGRSRSEARHAAPSGLLFRGHVSLDNGGGFASIRCSPRAIALGGATEIVLRAAGSARRYKLSLRCDDVLDGIQYQSVFTLDADAPTTVALPLSCFVPTLRGQPLRDAPRLDAARVRTIGLMVSDRQAGAFELRVDWIGCR